MRILFLILGLALYGAYTLVERMTEPARAATTEPASYGERAATQLRSTTMATATQLVGLHTSSLPSTGCSESALSVDNLEQLLTTLPEAQQAALVKVLNMSSSVWTSQLYIGDEGYGICLPEYDTVVLLPSMANDAIAQLQDLLPR